MPSSAFATDNRQDAVDKANQFIADCVADGGEPDADVTSEEVAVCCDYGDHQDYCSYDWNPPSSECGTVNHEAQPDPRWDLSPVTAEPIIHSGDVAAPPLSDGHHGHGTKHKKGGHRHRQ